MKKLISFSLIFSILILSMGSIGCNSDKVLELKKNLHVAANTIDKLTDERRVLHENDVISDATDKKLAEDLSNLGRLVKGINTNVSPDLNISAENFDNAVKSLEDSLVIVENMVKDSTAQIKNEDKKALVLALLASLKTCVSAAKVLIPQVQKEWEKLLAKEGEVRDGN